MSKKYKLKVGVQQDLHDLTVEVNDNQPRPWDGTDELNFVGGDQTRIDGMEKVTGRAKYSFDRRPSGMLWAKFLRSPHPAAIVTSVDVTAAKKLHGVRAVLTVAQKFPMTVRFAGQEILAVAADTEQIAEQALRLVKVEYNPQPFVVDVEKAIKADAPKVYAQTASNKRDPRIRPEDAKKEDIDALFAKSYAVIDQTYRTQVQTHSAMETHGSVAMWEDDQHLKVWASTQGTFAVRNDLAEYFGLPKSNVRVITEYMGGGFGAKLGGGIYYVMAAKLARATGKPVRLMLNRKEEHLAVGNRPNSVQHLRIGADKKGKLTAIQLESFGTAGIGGGAGTSGPARNIYETANIFTSETDVFTNGGPGAAFRAPGHPQGAFAMEQAIDELAWKLKMDPLEMRRINTLNDPRRQEEYRIGAEKIGWAKRSPRAGSERGVIKRGIGMANSVWYYIYGKGFICSIQVHSDGSVLLTNGVQDIGGGIGTVMAMVAAEELGLKPSDIEVKIGDTRYGLGPASGGSQTTAGISPAVRDAAWAAKQRILKIAAKIMGTKVQDLDAGDGKIFNKKNPQQSISWKKACSKIPGDQFTVNGERVEDNHPLQRRTIAGAQFADVSVDTGTGVITVNKVVAVHDCGRPMDRLTIRSQINGGIIQGISYALFEDRILDRNTGVMVNANLEQYKIAGSFDVPEIESVILDVNEGQSSTGAIGIGEPATVPTSAAIANAVYHAIGVRIRELPMTPDKVLAALQMKGGRV